MEFTLATACIAGSNRLVMTLQSDDAGGGFTAMLSCPEARCAMPAAPLHGSYAVERMARIDEGSGIDQMPDASNPAWRHLFRQTAGNFRSDDGWQRYNPGRYSGDFSELDELETCRQTDGKLHLKLVWPDLATPNSNEWKQVTNPVTASSGGVAGYEAVDVNFDQNYWGGLERSATYALLDGSVNNNRWMYAVGSAQSWRGGIPGPDNAVQSVELFAMCGGPSSREGWPWLDTNGMNNVAFRKPIAGSTLIRCYAGANCPAASGTFVAENSLTDGVLAESRSCRNPRSASDCWQVLHVREGNDYAFRYAAQDPKHSILPE